MAAMSAIGRLSTAPGVQRETRLPLLLASAASLVVAAIAGWIACTIVPTNVDVAWLLVVCDRLLDGARLHSDVVEVNPPLSVWLYMPFAFAGQMTGLPAELWLSIGLPLFALLSVGISARILGRAALVDRRAAWLAPAILFALTGLFTEDFGQREQFATIALLPWLALLAARDSAEDFSAGTRVERIAAGLGAALFVLIKPPVSVPALAVPALYLCIKRRSLRPLFTTETLFGAAVAVAYLAWLATFHLSFFVELMPLLRELYLPARRGVAEMLTSVPLQLFALLAASTWALSRPAGFDRPALLALLAALGYVPAFVLMGKGWPYQALPFLLLGMLAFLIQIARLPGLAGLSILAKCGLAAGIVVVTFLVRVNEPLARAEQRARLERAAAAITEVVEQPTVATIATRLQPAHPLTRMIGGDYRSRYPSLWMVENAARLIEASGDDPERAAQLKAMQEEFIVEAARDIARERPDIIFDAGAEESPGQSEIHASPAIARELENYRLLYRDTVVTVLVRSYPAAVAEVSAFSEP